MGIYAMEHGKHAAIEVPAAMSLDEIWALINTSEKTRKPVSYTHLDVYKRQTL